MATVAYANLYSQTMFEAQLKEAIDGLRDPYIASLAILYTISNAPIPLYIRQFEIIQHFRLEYINSLMLLETNTLSGLSEFHTTKRIGNPSAFGVVNIGDYGLDNLSHVIKTNAANNIEGVQIEFYMGLTYFNQFRKDAPYWMYTYSAIYCNNLLEDPQGKNSHMWCHYASKDMQIMLEKVEGTPYSSFLDQVTDPQRQVAVLARIVDAVDYMWKHNVTHGDLHAQNIKIVRFDYTKCGQSASAVATVATWWDKTYPCCLTMVQVL